MNLFFRPDLRGYGHGLKRVRLLSPWAVSRPELGFELLPEAY